MIKENQTIEFDTLTYRMFVETLSRLTNNLDQTAERCYVSSNEYLSEYMRQINLKNKKVATVGTSGDQFFNALLQGSRDITIIDANPYARIFVEYKMAMIKNFDYATFNNLIRRQEMFNWKVYSKISHSLSKTAKQFWDTLMLEIEDRVDDTIDQFDQNKLARQLVHNEAVFFSDFYTDDVAYSILQTILLIDKYKLEFLTADLHDFPNVLKDRYDVIMLSNIFAYHEIGTMRKRFEETVDKLYNNNLNPGGIIQVQYNYRHHYDSVDPTEMAGKKLRIVKLDDGHNPRSVYFLDKPEENNLSI